MAPLISKLLIANRGEVVVRIAKTAHRLGMSTVGVYSDLDANALHVDHVDVAVRLGGETPAESYLRGEAIIAAAKATGADAIHPGYGFLAESADFAQAVIEAGITWVGPQPRQIRLLGNKVSAKAAAVEAGVPTSPLTEVVPGKAPAGLTMPVLVKAAAGGGGRGMRVVRQHIDLAEAIAAASREAEAAFGDGSVFVEPFIERGRHVEVQIIGDGFGSVVHLGDRECSIQRRNQKVIEEAPAANLSDDVRQQLVDGALALARHVGYEGAGTVEFIVGSDDTISFLEVNTRLQVEHPVTEAVTGVDLVELQLLVAEGKRLPLRQDDIELNGHAIEARIVAEDPAQGWLPDVGTLASFSVGDGVRVDSGVRRGSIVSPAYDSMLAKVIAHSASRREAAAVLQRALRTSFIAGVNTNLASLAAIVAEPDFLRGDTFTTYLAEHPDVERPALPEDALDTLLIGATMTLEQIARSRNTITGFAPSGWRNLRTQGQRRTWTVNEVTHCVEYTVADGGTTVLLGPWPEPDPDGALPDDDRRSVLVRVLGSDGDRHMAIEVDGVRTVLEVVIDGSIHVSSSVGHASFDLAPVFVESNMDRIGSGPISPLPGTVIALHVAAGDSVVRGQLLMVVEAMKMEHKIVAPDDVTIADIRFGVGDRVDTGDVLVDFAEPSSADDQDPGNE